MQPSHSLLPEPTRTSDQNAVFVCTLTPMVSRGHSGTSSFSRLVPLTSAGQPVRRRRRRPSPSLAWILSRLVKTVTTCARYLWAALLMLARRQRVYVYVVVCGFVRCTP